MATYDDLVFSHRLFMKGYPFAHYALDPVPCTPMRRPLSEARVALVTSAGVHLPEQEPFDHSIKGGDTSFREIPNNVVTQTLRESHRSPGFDHTGIQADRNLAFPLDRFREFEAQGVIGTLNQRHFSFMGSIVLPRKLINETSAQVARMLREDGVDVVLLTPA
ncbi:MAG: glycine/sarcosine/betaine reductase selenoprotein B family protein [Blastocatellia bacterium]